MKLVSIPTIFINSIRNQFGRVIVMCEIDIECSLSEITEYNYNTWQLNECTVDHDDLLFKDFFSKYMIKNLPCLIKNVAGTWECTEKWVVNNQINYEYFIEKYGDLHAPVADCKNIEYNSHSKTNMKVMHFMEYLKYDKSNRLLYLKDWHLKHIRPNDNFYIIPLYFAHDWLNEYAVDNKEDDFMFVYIGPKGSWTPFHEDVYCSYSWSVNITGRKKWILLPPGEENQLKDKFGNYPITFNPEKHNNIKYFEIVQEKGDGIFVPSGWHHQVINMLDTISINHNWINACNIHIVWKALQNSLLTVQHQIEEFKETQEFYSDCQLMLRSLFGMDFEIFIRFICYIAKKRLNQLNGESKICLGNYYLSNNTIKFDLRQILNVMHSIHSHPVFLNNHMRVTLDDFIEIKNNVAQIFNK